MIPFPPEDKARMRVSQAEHATQLNIARRIFDRPGQGLHIAHNHSAHTPRREALITAAHLLCACAQNFWT